MYFYYVKPVYSSHPTSRSSSSLIMDPKVSMVCVWTCVSSPPLYYSNAVLYNIQLVYVWSNYDHEGTPTTLWNAVYTWCNGSDESWVTSVFIAAVDCIFLCLRPVDLQCTIVYPFISVSLYRSLRLYSMSYWHASLWEVIHIHVTSRCTSHVCL